MFEGINWTYWALSAGLASCIGTTLLAYNAIALVMFMREDSEGPASGLAKGAWAVGLASLLLSGLPASAGAAMSSATHTMAARITCRSSLR